MATKSCLVDGPPTTVGTGCDALGGRNQAMVYRLLLTSPSPPPLAVPPPSPFPPSPAPVYPASLPGTNARWYPAGAFYADPGTTVNSMWTPLNCAWSYGTMTCTGPFQWAGWQDTPVNRAGNIKDCQDLAATYGFDTVALRSYRRRPFCDSIHSSECLACKGCAYYAGGRVPAGTTCNAAVVNCDDAFDGPNCAANTTYCNTAGCDRCINSTGAWSVVNQVYLVRPAGVMIAPGPPLPPNPPPSPSYSWGDYFA